MKRLLLFLVLTATTHAQLARVAAPSINLPADLPSATGYTTQNALGTLTFSVPMCTAFPAGETNRLFVVERGSYSNTTMVHMPGTIQVVSNLGTTPAKSAYLSLTSLLQAGETVRADGENGLLSLVFHPNYATNGTFYLYFSIQAGGSLFQRLHQVTVSNPASNSPVIAQHKPLLTILDRDNNHNGGDLAFGTDGFLYISLGDEGGGGDNRNNARFINHRLDPVGTTGRVTRTGFWGQMLRLAVEVDPVAQPGIFPAGSVAPNPHVQNSTTFPAATHGNYRVPADNPFHGFTMWHNVAVDPATVRTEIFATGLRNPFRFTIDLPTQRIFLGDVGQGQREEMNIITKGGDYGWSWREGLIAYASPPAPTTPPVTGFNPVNPIFDYDQTNDGIGNDAVIYGVSVVGGIIYRGNQLTELSGKLIFADVFGGGIIAALTETSPGVWSGQRLGTRSQIVDFGTDPRNGEPLLTSLLGTVYHIVRSGTSGTLPSATLSATGAFSNVTTLTPAAGVVPAEPNVDFWSDYATKSRWFAIKNTVDTIGYSAGGNWTFPTGMVWVKHFDIDTTRGNPATRRKLETRILVKTATGSYGLSYKWRADQSDADLVVEQGLSEVIPSSSPAQTWRYPSRGECIQCHTPAGGHALSFNSPQLNRLFTHGTQTANQITALSAAGYFSTAVTGVESQPAFAPSHDTTASREWRVRSYLAVNCVQCHQPGAPGNWDARHTTPTDLAGLINGTLVNPGGDPLNRWCVPGDTTHSMILQRQQGAGVPRMPPIGTNERDLAAEQLMIDWITQDLPSRQNLTQWTTTNFPGGGATSLPTADPDGDSQNNVLEFLRGTLPLANTIPYLTEPMIEAGVMKVSFVHPANRAAIVETSLDMANWAPWNVPGNGPLYPAVATTREVTGPIDTTSRYFRVRITAQ